MKNQKLNIIIAEIYNKIFFGNISLQYLKLSYLVNYALLFAIIIITFVTPPAKGYEFSIYNAYPSYFWFLLILTITMSQLNAIISVLGNTTKKYWVLGFIVIMLTDSLILFLPLIRGYFIYGSADVLTHIGYMWDIVNYGSIAHNHYPPTHILGYSISKILGIPQNIITMVIPALFSLFSLICWYILGREIFDEKPGGVILAVIGALPMYGIMNSLYLPNGITFLILPLVLYTLIKSQNNPHNREIIITIIFLSVFIVFSHPLIALMLILIYSFFCISEYLLRKIYPSNIISNHILTIGIITTLVFSAWNGYIYIINYGFKPIIPYLTGNNIVKSEAITMRDTLDIVNIDYLSIVKLGLQIFGIDIILGIISLICISYLIFLYTRKQILIKKSTLFFIFCFMSFFLLSVSIFFVMNQFGYERIYNIALIFSIIIISNTIVVAYSKFSDNDNIHKHIISIFVCILIITLTVLSIFTLHLSPIVKQQNQQVTIGNIIGMTTFFETMDTSIGILEYGIAQTRYFEAIYGTRYPKANVKYAREVEWSLRPTDHFGYDTSHDFGSNYNRKQYFVLTQDARNYYKNVYPEYPDKWRFTDNDYKCLETDPSTIRIYSNGGLDTYMIN